MLDKNRVIVTGMSWCTALGDELMPVWQRLLHAESGLTQLPSSYTLRNNLAGAIVKPVTQDIDEKLHEITKNTVQKALLDAGITHTSQEILLIVGTSFGARLDSEISNQQSLHIWTDSVAEELNLTPIALSTACSSASDAMSIGAALIEAGVADICVCGGADMLSDAKLLAHSALGTMSPTILRSFDQNRDGTILGEGAGFIVLEKHQKDISKKVYAYLLGSGCANDAAGLTSPDDTGNGIRLAIIRSIHDAQLTLNDIGIINAHGSGTLVNDRVESSVYSEMFAGNQPLIFATKGAFGHSLGATGALEAISLILALCEQSIPPICHLHTPINDNLVFPRIHPEPHSAIYGLSLTIGFGGFNTSLIFERYIS